MTRLFLDRFANVLLQPMATVVRTLNCRHSSVDLSVPTILPPQVRVTSTLSMLLSFIVKLVPDLNENKQKEARSGPFLKRSF